MKEFSREQEKRDLIALYGKILRLRNILTAFDDFEGNEILTERQQQDYQGMYIDLYTEFRVSNKGEKENINDDLVFEIELIQQVEFNIDYILNLIGERYGKSTQKKKVRDEIERTIDTTVGLRNKKDLIMRFIDSLKPGSVVRNDWAQFVKKEKVNELNEIIKKEELCYDETWDFMTRSFEDGFVTTGGAAIANVIRQTSMFHEGGERDKRKETAREKLINFFNRFFDISSDKLGV